MSEPTIMVTPQFRERLERNGLPPPEEMTLEEQIEHNCELLGFFTKFVPHLIWYSKRIQ